MTLMVQTMRWFGPSDPVSLADIRQAGCTGVVTALHSIPVGNIWTVDEIRDRKKSIEEAGLEWKVVESLPVHEDIKKRSGNCDTYIENYIQSLHNLARCGLAIITYNFMPVLDWMRTDIAFTLPDGSKALRFEKAAFTAFDIFLLKRTGAEVDYSEKEISAARLCLEGMSEQQRETLYKNALLGLPGSDVGFTESQILDMLQTYSSIDAYKLKQNLFHFLQNVVPVAEMLRLRMAIHPDDPPYSILGLPRVVSTELDLKEIIDAVPSPANGICFCTGSLGVLQENDLVGMVKRLGDHIHFLHLRNTRRDAEGNFYESDHLDGDTNMVQILKEILLLMKRTGVRLPMRPDHGHQMMDDLNKKTNPGYSAIGRLRGLAELRGLELGISSLLEE